MIQIIIENGPRGQSGLGERGKASKDFIQKLLKQAFDEVRDELARGQMAVPLNITEMELRNNPQPRVR